jgi:molybdopterin-guanine dinucleotide biosynthesis protein A
MVAHVAANVNSAASLMTAGKIAHIAEHVDFAATQPSPQMPACRAVNLDHSGRHAAGPDRVHLSQRAGQHHPPIVRIAVDSEKIGQRDATISAQNLLPLDLQQRLLCQAIRRHAGQFNRQRRVNGKFQSQGHGDCILNASARGNVCIMGAAPVSTAGMILCGGHSRRMASPKALLPFGSQTLLERMVGSLSPLADPLLVVAAADQPLPRLPPQVRVLRDRCPGQGPLEGMATGLAALACESNWPAPAVVFVAACDLPFLTTAVARRIVELTAGYDAAVPLVGRQHHPLAAAYRLSVLPVAERLLAAGRRSMHGLIAEIRSRNVTEDELRQVDPELQALLNINDRDAYRAALAAAGLRVSDSAL